MNIKIEININITNNINLSKVVIFERELLSFSGILLARSTLRTKKAMGDCAFEIAAPILWNSLPLSVRQAGTIDNFKRLLKTYLFTKTYN